MVEIDEGILGPELSPKLFTGDDTSRPLDQQTQDLKGLLLKLDLRASFSQLTAPEVEIEDPKRALRPLVMLELGKV